MTTASARKDAAQAANARSAIANAAADAAAPAARSKTIGQAAKEAGVHVETVRYYERLGLIPRPTARQGYRTYPAATIDRIRSIKRAQDFGFSLREIEDLFSMSAMSDSSCKAMCAKVDEKVREIEARIESLIELRDELKGLVKGSSKTGPATNCQVFKAFVHPR